MIPKKIQTYYKITYQTMDGNNRLIDGTLMCCNASDFEVFFAGKIKHGLFHKMFLYPKNDIIKIMVRCKKCGKVIPVFNSSIDGYEHCEDKYRNICVLNQSLNCKKCRNNNYSLSIKYEYPEEQELRELEISDIDNAFSWIWITLKCNDCGTEYKNFVDCETT